MPFNLVKVLKMIMIWLVLKNKAEKTMQRSVNDDENPPVFP